MATMTSMRSNVGGAADAITELAALFGNRLVTSQAVREQHGNTTTWIACEPPEAVIYPQSTEDVQKIVGVCASHSVPVIPFGTGTSFEGHVNAPFGGVSIDLKDMSQVVEVHQEDFDCIVQPGITRKRLNEHLRDQGLSFRLTQVQMPLSAAWHRRGHRVQLRFAMAP